MALGPIFASLGTSSLMSVLMILMTILFYKCSLCSYKGPNKLHKNLKDMQQGYQEQLEETTNILLFKNH